MNEFQIISKLGEGAYSVVYKVKRLVDNNIYALKKVKLLNLSDKEKQNALNEVRILASLKSKNVISYKECFFDETDSFLGIVMEYADKGDLYQKITELKKLQITFEEADIWKILIQMIKGLKSLHDLKILHRDLKSANVFLFSDGTAKLGDLNVSKVAKKGLGYTQTGTPYYASPEVWRDKPYDSKSDLWSLGCVIYEMTMLKPPFRAENMEGLYNKVIKGQFPKINDKYSSELAEIVKLLIQVNPESRPSCDQLLKSQIIQNKIEGLNSLKIFEENVNENINLLQTIRVPNNLLYLTDRLPTSNYEKFNEKSHKHQSFSNKAKNKNEILPDIKITSKRNVIKSKREIEGNSSQSPVRNEENSINNSIQIKEVNIVSPMIKKEENVKPVYYSIEHDQGRGLSIENRGRYNKNKNNNLVLNNCVNNDLTLLPKINNKNDLSLSPVNYRSEKENHDNNKKKEESRNIVYNEKKVKMLLQKVGREVSNNRGSCGPQVLNNRNQVIINKYQKNKRDNSYLQIGSPKKSKNYDYRQVLEYNKLPIIQNSRRMRVIQYKLI